MLLYQQEVSTLTCVESLSKTLIPLLRSLVQPGKCPDMPCLKKCLLERKASTKTNKQTNKQTNVSNLSNQGEYSYTFFDSAHFY